MLFAPSTRQMRIQKRYSSVSRSSSIPEAFHRLMNNFVLFPGGRLVAHRAQGTKGAAEVVAQELSLF